MKLRSIVAATMSIGLLIVAGAYWSSPSPGSRDVRTDAGAGGSASPLAVSAPSSRTVSAGDGPVEPLDDEIQLTYLPDGFVLEHDFRQNDPSTGDFDRVMTFVRGAERFTVERMHGLGTPSNPDVPPNVGEGFFGTTVRGHPGFEQTLDRYDKTLLLWSEADWVTFMMQAYGVDLAELHRIADGIIFDPHLMNCVASDGEVRSDGTCASMRTER